ncbi:ribonuclease R [Lysobacter pythonis]|uniref:Ribonuclease R n=2 Tax=Solilutibacter pythonis TaxID=2483112 RepID=A0A3M2I4C4_9GAMM|nr:ribonuclease R [Lysobacter pythonis]RMH93054.1 ribonuclease R [Lysobacter pythonis]
MPDSTAVPGGRSHADKQSTRQTNVRADVVGRKAKPQAMPANGGPHHDPHFQRESRRYAEPIASREYILQVLGDADGPLDADAIAALLGLTAPDRREALDRRLGAMVRDGQLLQNRRGGFAPTRQLDLIAGVVIANPEGFGFLRPDAGGGEDLFLPPAEMRKVLHGDRVLASITGMDRRGRSEGTIVEVLERGVTRLVGRYEEEAGVGFVVPDDARIQRNVMIPQAERNDAKTGQLVVAEITQPQDARRPPIGRVVAVLGDKLTPSLVVEAAIHGRDIPHEFPRAVLDEAAAVPLEVVAADLRERADLRGLPLVTIDGEDAKDFDDAVYCERVRGGWRLVVAIADVSHYVRPGTPLDEEAEKRATSVYFPGYVVPMLPETLSNGICSLNPKVDRLCFVCDMKLDNDGVPKSSTFYTAVMNSHARLTYTEVWNAVGEGIPAEDRAAAEAKIGELLPHVRQLHQMYQRMAKARESRGAIEFESGEVRFVLDNRGEVTQAGMLQRNDAHKLIEECMIAANVEAAKYLLKTGIPAPFRIHERPPEQKYADLQEFLKEFKLSMPPWSRVHPRDFTALIHQVRERADAALIESVLLRSQSLAVYSPANVGHFGLALESYAHFTSPIRRYPDLLVHRAIKHGLAGGDVDDFRYSAREMDRLSLQCSERARRADEAEREVDERYRAAWMERHIGGEFDGVISGVTSFGLFVELDDSKVNGLVHVTQLPHDYYHFDAIRKTLTGERRGREFRLGDRVRIVVLKASLEERKIDFRLAEDNDVEKAQRGQPARRQKRKY